MADNLTPQQETLAEIYVWIHRRAEYLRRQRAAQKQAQAATQQTPPPEDNTDGHDYRRD